jgi:hypothetical protein
MAKTRRSLLSYVMGGFTITASLGLAAFLSMGAPEAQAAEPAPPPPPVAKVIAPPPVEVKVEPAPAPPAEVKAEPAPVVAKKKKPRKKRVDLGHEGY